MRPLPRLSASSRLSQAPLPLLMPLLSPHLLSVMSIPPVSFPLLLSKFENFSALWDKLEDVSLINHHPLSSHFLINCLHLACLPDLGHDSMGFVQMEDLLPQQYRLLTGLKTKCIRMYINLSILNQFFQSIISLFTMQDSPKHEGEKILETLKLLLILYANKITFLKTVSKFSYVHICWMLPI